MFKKAKKIVKQISLEKILLFFILFLALYVRIYRINDLLGFYFDQGRDALVIWDLINNGKFFLIGPTTGIAGIFRGPYYYYLITPLYFLGKGNPVYPSIFLSLLSVVAIYILYFLVKKTQGKLSAMISLFLASFSYYLIIASRWLSNPTPMFLLSILLIYGMFRVLDNKKWGWEIISLVSGLSLFNFGSSGELFYFLAIGVFIFWQWNSRPSLKRIILCLSLFFLTFAPLTLFDLRHDGILRNNILNSFVSEKSFALPTKHLFESRLSFYYEVFSKILFHTRGKLEIILLVSLLILCISFLRNFLKNKYIKVIFLVLISPLIGLFFYQGNKTVLYEYYMTGYYLIIIFFVSLILGKLGKYVLGKIFVVTFLIVFLINNLNVIKFKLSDQVGSVGSIALKNELQAVNWVFENSQKGEFNVDVYVPPVIPYSYDYLFKWKSQEKKATNYKQENVEVLYTIFENDSQHPDRLEKWLERQEGIGKILEVKSFGGITIQKRTRI